MPSARTIVITVAIALFLPLVLGLFAIKWVESQLPIPQGERVRGPHDLVGVQTQGSYAWVIPSSNGVVLVDAGLDPQAKALSREIGGRTIQAVLVTHGHGDHTGGLTTLGSVPVYASSLDIALARGEREPRGFMARVFSAAFGTVPADVDWQETAGGTELQIDGLRIAVVSVPGHTDGSMAYLWEDVLFTGDTVFGGDPLSTAPESLADTPAAVQESLEKLLSLDFDAIADGHVGITTTARSALFRLVNATLAPPTTSVRSQAAPGGSLARVEGTGVWVRTPVPDVRGEQPDYLVFPDGQRWRLLGEVASAHQGTGQTVTVRGHRIESQGGPGIPVEVESIADTSAPSPGTSTLESRLGQWVTLTGSVRHFQPLAAGARFGEGIFTVTGDPPATLILSSPLSLVALAEGHPDQVTLFGRLAENRTQSQTAPKLILFASEPLQEPAP